MFEAGPCGPQSNALHVFLILMNTFQAVAIAYIAQRARRKNREEGNGTGHSSE